MASLSLTGNGLQSSTESQSSSKSHSPASSATSTMTITGYQDRAITPNSTSDIGDQNDLENAKVKVAIIFLSKLNLFFL